MSQGNAGTEQGNAGTDVVHVHARIHVPITLNFTGPEEVADDITEKFRQGVMDALDQAIFSSWQKFARTRPSAIFAIFGKQVLVSYGGGEYVWEIPSTRSSEEDVRRLVETYQLPMADETTSQKIITLFSQCQREMEEVKSGFKAVAREIVGDFERARMMAQVGLELKHVADVFPEGKFGLVGGQIFLLIKEGEVLDATPRSEDGTPLKMSEEDLREVLSEAKIPFVEGEDAILYRNVFQAMETKVDIDEMMCGAMLANLARRTLEGVFLPRVGGLIGGREADGGYIVGRFDLPFLNTEEDARAFCLKFQLPIAEGEQAEKILKLYRELEGESHDEDAEEPVFG